MRWYADGQRFPGPVRSGIPSVKCPTTLARLCWQLKMESGAVWGQGLLPGVLWHKSVRVFCRVLGA